MESQGWRLMAARVHSPQNRIANSGLEDSWRLGGSALGRQSLGVVKAPWGATL